MNRGNEPAYPANDVSCSANTRGMTIREDIAARMAQGLLASGAWGRDRDGVTMESRELADLMLAELARTQAPAETTGVIEKGGGTDTLADHAGDEFGRDRKPDLRDTIRRMLAGECFAHNNISHRISCGYVLSCIDGINWVAKCPEKIWPDILGSLDSIRFVPDPSPTSRRKESTSMSPRKPFTDEEMWAILWQWPDNGEEGIERVAFQKQYAEHLVDQLNDGEGVYTYIAVPIKIEEIVNVKA